VGERNVAKRMNNPNETKPRTGEGKLKSLEKKLGKAGKSLPGKVFGEIQKGGVRKEGGGRLQQS